MTLNEIYKSHRKVKLSRYIKLFLVIAFVYFTSFTFSSYNTLLNVNASVGCAKWAIKVNNVDICTENTQISDKIELIPTDAGAQNGPIKAGQEGYFDIKVDPAGTEVAVDYSLILDFSKMPEEIEMVSYSKIENSIETNQGSLPANNTIEGSINLSGSRVALTQNESVTYRIYWKWKGEDYEIDYDSYEVDAEVLVQQKIV